MNLFIYFIKNLTNFLFYLILFNFVLYLHKLFNIKYILDHLIFYKYNII